MIKLYLFDIEGTTTDINFVHQVLFPYSREHLKDFVLQYAQHAAVKAAIEDVKATVKEENQKEIDLNGAIETLLQWIREDRKHGALKEIQGLIWDLGYAKNDFKGHLYPDVEPFFKSILQTGAQVGIYSSGSVHAQKLIFGHSVNGDLTPMIAHYFDTKMGGKREQASYSNIANAVHLRPEEIHFFSDITEELAAAQAAGFQVTHILRPGTLASAFKGITGFNFFDLQKKIIFFDGVCGLCDHFITFMVDADRKKVLMFATQQGDAFKAPDIQKAITPEMGDSIYYLKGDKLYSKSTAVLTAMGDLGGAWKLILIFKIIPSPIRDFLYDLVAKNRYRIFGKHETCRIPTPEERARFIN